MILRSLHRKGQTTANVQNSELQISSEEELRTDDDVESGRQFFLDAMKRYCTTFDKEVLRRAMNERFSQLPDSTEQEKEEEELTHTAIENDDIKYMMARGYVQFCEQITREDGQLSKRNVKQSCMLQIAYFHLIDLAPINNFASANLPIDQIHHYRIHKIVYEDVDFE